MHPWFDRPLTGCRREPILKKAVNDEVAKHYGRCTSSMSKHVCRSYHHTPCVCIPFLVMVDVGLGRPIPI